MRKQANKLFYEWLTSKELEKASLCLIVCPEPKLIPAFKASLEFFLPEHQILSVRGSDALPFEAVSPSATISSERSALFHHLTRRSAEERLVILCDPAALMERTVSAALHPDGVLRLDQNTELEGGLKQLEEELLRRGYHNTRFVEQAGEFSIKGRTADIYSSFEDHPCRLEIMDDQVQRLSAFDLESQRSIKALDSYLVIPAHERALLKLERSQKQFCLAVEELAEQRETPSSELRSFILAVEEQQYPPGVENLLPLVFPAESLLERAVSASARIVLLSEEEVLAKLDEYEALVSERHARLVADQHLIAERESNFAPISDVLSKLDSESTLRLTELGGADGGHSEEHCKSLEWLELAMKSRYRRGRSLEPLEKALSQWKEEKYRIAFIVNNEARRRRVESLLTEIDCGFVDERDSSNFPDWLEAAPEAAVSMLSGYEGKGFIESSEKFVLVTDFELFGNKSQRKKEKNKEHIDLRRLMSSLSELNPGDYVVHSDFGIGCYQGLEQRKIQGKMSDLLKIEYADSILFLPVQQIGKIQQYIGADGGTPRMDRLGGSSWKKTKGKVKQAVVALAGDLIRLYAERDSLEGFQFDAVNLDDDRFGDEFPFNETPDQLKAIDEILSDMNRERPMDRLVCGDVGFGKTEVALRAVFKALQSGKQVAVLGPTTILVEQHLKSFQKRFADYPFRIAAVSRFNSSKENKEILAKVEEGTMDVIIGTHRLLQKDVFFHDLGLLVIDEEHRFGVKHKERLKQMRRDVDVLTMTATPIPRTLHMSLLDIRDISIISTPPLDRQSVKTYVAKREESLLRDVLLREHARGGQSFFVHNRVETIATIAEGLRELLPELRFEYAHGQMREQQLEAIMHRFVEHEIDVLIATTIIESGIDIANANTIMIDRADTYGLAQLYQLRGRVGRSKEQAYCYFLAPEKKKLGSDARERLAALQALENLGVGFHLALRDLEIRGAGNLLGKEQSGNVSSVGYELYMKILKEAVEELRRGGTSSVEELIEPEISAEFEAYIPEDYIPDVSERLILYQRLAALENDAQAEELIDEIQDRYGSPSEVVENMISLMLLRADLRREKVVQLEQKGERLSFSFSPRAALDSQKVLTMASERKDMRVSANNSITLDSPKDLLGPVKLRRFAGQFIKSLK